MSLAPESTAFVAQEVAPVVIMPRAHQVEALAGLTEGLLRGTKVQAHMCCGSGKTFTQAFLARDVIGAVEAYRAAVLVCFVPNRALIYQNARNYKLVFQDTVSYLGVCSETDMSGVVDAQDMGILTTTTDRAQIADFLRQDQKPRIVFSTYQSIAVLRAALSDARGPDAALTLGIFDEAHRTAGNKRVEDLFAFGLDDANFPMQRRAFFTATPRVVTGRGAQGLSMADTDLYGSVAYEYPFSVGIKDGNVVDYDLWVPVITRAELARFAQDRNLEGEERALVAMIALEKVMARTGQSRFLTYHQRIAGSQAFAKALSGVLPADVLVAHVDGTTPGREREALMQALRSGSKAVLTNCKAFVEGVDAPGLQGVVFVDPRKSVIDVVQAVGRLSRPDPSDPAKRGSIIAPILTESMDPAALARAAKVSGFDTLIQVAEALRANDDALEEDIMERSRALGRGDDTIASLHNMIVLVDEEETSVDIAVLEQAITVATMKELHDPFAFTVGQLEAYVNTWGYLPTREDEPKLFAWMTSVRKKHATGKLESAHAQLLDGIEGWTWIGERARVETIVGHILAFRDRAQRMPSARFGAPAEADLHAYLLEAQEVFLRKGLADKLTQALYEENALFFTQEVLGKRAHVSGYFAFAQSADMPTPTVFFHPRADKHRKTIPVFQTGHTMLPRAIKLVVGRTERERLLALSENHSVRVSLGRAGLVQDPFSDGRVLDWHAGSVDRGEREDTSKDSFLWLVSRLQDRKVSGRQAYSRIALREKQLRPGAPATQLNTLAPTGTIEEVVVLMERVRQAFLAGRLTPVQVELLNKAPGFAWLEEDASFEIVVALLIRLVGCVGAPTMIASYAEGRDDGLTNTMTLLLACWSATPPSDRAQAITDAPEVFDSILLGFLNK